MRWLYPPVHPPFHGVPPTLGVGRTLCAFWIHRPTVVRGPVRRSCPLFFTVNAPVGSCQGDGVGKLFCTGRDLSRLLFKVDPPRPVWVRQKAGKFFESFFLGKTFSDPFFFWGPGPPPGGGTPDPPWVGPGPPGLKKKPGPVQPKLSPPKMSGVRVRPMLSGDNFPGWGGMQKNLFLKIMINLIF